MPYLSEDNTRRFDGLAEAYDAYRRPYPDALFQDLVKRVLADARCAVDVGAGTGISTEGLLDHLPQSWMVIGVEPGTDMRRVLARRLKDRPNFQANPSPAEAIRLPDGCAGLVAAFAAVYWFDQPAFFAEARRLLQPGGLLAIARSRRVSDGVVGELDAYIRSELEMLRDVVTWEKTKQPDVADLDGLSGFGHAVLSDFPWEETMSCSDLLDIYLTRPMVVDVIRTIGLRQFRARFEAICHANGGRQRIRVKWISTLLSATAV